MALLLDKSIKELFVEAPPLLILPVFYFDKLFTKKTCFLQRAYYSHYPTMKLFHQWYSFNISCFKLKIVKRIGLLGMASIKISLPSFILIIAITFKISFKKKRKKNALKLYNPYILIQEFYDSFNSIPNPNPNIAWTRQNKTVSLYITSKIMYGYYQVPRYRWAHQVILHQ